MRVIKLHPKPVISVIIPYDKDRGYLNEAMGSAMNQTYKRVEIVVSCSSRSLSYNLNKGVVASSGQWIKILAEDDILPPDSLANFAQIIEENSTLDWIVADAENFGKKDWSGIYKGCTPTLDQMLYLNCIHGGAVIYKRELFFETGGFNESLITAEEYDFHLLLLSKGYKVGYLPKTVYRYRVHDKNKYIAMKIKNNAKRRQYINNNIKSLYGKYSDCT